MNPRNFVVSVKVSAVRARALHCGARCSQSQSMKSGQYLGKILQMGLGRLQYWVAANFRAYR